jgi:hypothetical protein
VGRAGFYDKLPHLVHCTPRASKAAAFRFWDHAIPLPNNKCLPRYAVALPDNHLTQTLLWHAGW